MYAPDPCTFTNPSRQDKPSQYRPGDYPQPSYVRPEHKTRTRQHTHHHPSRTGPNSETDTIYNQPRLNTHTFPQTQSVGGGGENGHPGRQRASGLISSPIECAMRQEIGGGSLGRVGLGAVHYLLFPRQEKGTRRLACVGLRVPVHQIVMVLVWGVYGHLGRGLWMGLVAARWVKLEITRPEEVRFCIPPPSGKQTMPVETVIVALCGSQVAKPYRKHNSEFSRSDAHITGQFIRHGYLLW
ncbi:hypothetical protein B0J17DRAFT_88389 [Rhizoctonia solani]|nr:hypothetical protein B0J17DRAFT_88389 [Rhizoctonia solani]